MLVLSYGHYFMRLICKEIMKTLIVNIILRVHCKCIFYMHELHHITKKKFNN